MSGGSIKTGLTVTQTETVAALQSASGVVSFSQLAGQAVVTADRDRHLLDPGALSLTINLSLQSAGGGGGAGGSPPTHVCHCDLHSQVQWRR